MICSSRSSIDSGGEDTLVVGEEGIVEGGGDEARREDGAGEDELDAPNIVKRVFCFNGAGFLDLLTAMVDVVVVAGQTKILSPTSMSSTLFNHNDDHESLWNGASRLQPLKSRTTAYLEEWSDI